MEARGALRERRRDRQVGVVGAEGEHGVLEGRLERRAQHRAEVRLLLGSLRVRRGRHRRAVERRADAREHLRERDAVGARVLDAEEKQRLRRVARRDRVDLPPRPARLVHERRHHGLLDPRHERSLVVDNGKEEVLALVERDGLPPAILRHACERVEAEEMQLDHLLQRRVRRQLVEVHRRRDHGWCARASLDAARRHGILVGRQLAARHSHTV
mmetsp:Transcript_17819/g.46974  ORF Transcript_17819/g.46974 Transcript_17819/m.46974 type:complete len:214 (-) Transcript_17819:43-684(-)